jgi:hypothetical protein
LVIIANNTKVLVLARKQEEDAFLDRIGVLVFVDHQVGQFPTEACQNVGMTFE